ncbi:MAG: HAD-IC family P-type ATPase [Sphaerochaetaceae bacterium]
MLTGDNELTAKNIASQVGIDKIEANVLPTEKAKIVEKYQKENKIVIMVGDGINDAPSLVQVDVGFAFGNGSDIAIQSADVVLMKNELVDVYKTYRLSSLTIKNIKQNLFWAFFYNSIGIPIAAGVLFAFGGFLSNPMIGSFAMSLSSILVVTNALRLKSKKID